MKNFNLCLLGFGNVGRALARLLVEKTVEMREEFRLGWRVTGVATRRMGWLMKSCNARLAPNPPGIGGRIVGAPRRGPRIAWPAVALEFSVIIPVKDGADSIPALLIFKSSQLIDKLVGLQPKEAIARRLASV